LAEPGFSLRDKDERILDLVSSTDRETLATWAIDCVERVLPFFEQQFPGDRRPRMALETLQIWIDTGEFDMATIRKASLDAHAAAREVGEDSPARSAARAAGQAVAAAHVPAHAIGAANYALQATYRAADPAHAESGVARERNWQYRRLLELRQNKMNDDVVAVYRPPSIIIANMLKGVLDSEGIRVELRSLQLPMYDDLFKTALGCWGEILVRKSDAEKASLIIKRYLNSVSE
jgi:hypothetical protein